MNPLATLAASTPAQSIAHALGWTLLHFLWQGALIAIILACVLALLSERSPQPRYLAACAALILMMATPFITFARLLAQEYRTAHAVTAFISLDPITVRATGEFSEPLVYRLTGALDRSMPALLVLWFAGVLVLLGRLSMGLIVARQMKSLGTEAPPYDLLSTFQRITQRIGVSRPVRLLHSALVQVPTVIGWLRPVVLIPAGCLAGLSPAQLEAILAHELAHIRRHDYLISVLQSVVEALLFYHPAVWWVSRRIRTEREHCCDDLAVRIGGDPLTYARALSLLAERSAALPAIALGANGGILTMRIKRLLAPKEGPATSQLAAVTLLGVVIAATGLCIGTAARAQAQNQAQAPTPASAANQNADPQLATNNQQLATHPAAAPKATPQLISSNATPTPANPQVATNNQQPATNLAPVYQKWLNEDARWIITPSERAAFLQLSTDRDRDNFIADFWNSRNPAGAASNTFRSEHYQRITYANQHFAAAGSAGWETDRGRIYIIYGEPSTIDALTSSVGHPYQIWSYSFHPHPGQNESIRLQFVDLCNCGDYRLQSQSSNNSSSSSSSSSNSSSSSSHSENGVEQHPKPESKIAAPTPQSSRAKPAINRVSYAPAPAPQSPSTDPRPPIRVASGVMAGQVVSRVNPIYPPDAKAAHVQGAVVLHAVISSTGEIKQLEAISGPEMLMGSAMDAVRQWRYKPYLLNGQPIEVETTITVTYSFEGPPLSPPDDQMAAQDAARNASQNLAKNEAQNAAQNAARNAAKMDEIQPRRIGGSVSAPVVIYQNPPEFSDEAKQDKTFTSGHVLIHLWVDQQGNPQHVYVVRGIGKGLDEKALEAVRQYKFTPAMENGKPVLVELNIEVNFQRF